MPGQFTFLTSLCASTLLAPSLRADDNDYFKSCICAAGDVDRDGTPDFMVASRDGVLPEAVWILSGRDGATLARIARTEARRRLWLRFGGCRDMDGNGTSDVLVRASAWHEGRMEGNNFSRVTICSPHARAFSGRTGALLHDIDGGWSVCAAEDLNVDGHADVLVGSPANGTVEVLSGSDGCPLRHFEASQLEGVPSGFGTAVLCVGDVDDDEVADFAIGAPGEWANGLGCVLLLSGRDGRKLAIASGGCTDDSLG